MDNRMLPRVGPVPADAPSAPSRRPYAPASGFEKALAGVLKVSQHAEKRLRERNLKLGAEDMKGLSEAVAAAGRAGSKMAAVVAGGTVLVVSPQNRTVVTALGISDQMTMINRVDTLVFVGRTSRAEAAQEETASPGRTEGALPAGHWSLWDQSTLSETPIDHPGKERD